MSILKRGRQTHTNNKNSVKLKLNFGWDYGETSSVLETNPNSMF